MLYFFQDHKPRYYKVKKCKTRSVGQKFWPKKPATAKFEIQKMFFFFTTTCDVDVVSSCIGIDVGTGVDVDVDVDGVRKKSSIFVVETEF